ncbi:MAG: PAS domain-containing protein, partial [Xanthomonadales bacterium]|nr:PAS domain-containing protein [Xanthomonadales bacterium]
MIRILVVDDHPQNRDYLCTLLQAHGHEMQCASNGAEALAQARAAPPDLVVSDLLMPVLDGYSLLREWRADPQLRALPFIVYTATYTEEEDERLALDLGADAFLLKPCEPELLLERVRAVLAAPKPVAAGKAAPVGGEEALMERYSRVLIRKLEERSRQLEAANRELRHDVDERHRSAVAQRASEARLRAIIDSEPECVKLVSVDGRLLEMNAAGLRMVEADDAGQVLGKAVLGLVHPEDREAFLDLHLRACAGESGVLEFRIIGLRGRERWVDMHSTPLREGDGSVTAVLSVTRDITVRRIAAASERALLHDLDAERARLVLAQRIGRIGNWESDLDSGRVFWSEEMHRIFETNPIEFQPNLKSLLLRVHAEDRAAAEHVFKESLRHPGGQFQIEHRIAVGNGRIKHVEQRWEVVGENGRAHLVFGTTRDISEQHAAARALQLEHERLLEAQRVARIGSWEFDLASGQVQWSEQTHRLFETDPATHQPSFDGFIERLHVDDRPRLLEAWQRSITEPALSMAAIQYRVPFADGRCKFLEAQGQVFTGLDGAPVRVLGTVRDVTEQKLAEAAEKRSNALLQQSEERFREMAENVSDVFYNYDPAARRMLYMNPAFERVFGRPLAEIRDNPHAYMDCVHPDDIEAVLAAFDAQLRGE